MGHVQVWGMTLVAFLIGLLRIKFGDFKISDHTREAE